jgi:hypothetical protein
VTGLDPASRVAGPRRGEWAETARAFALSHAAAVDGHEFMTDTHDSPDLLAIAYEAQVEIQVAEAIQTAVTSSDDPADACDTAEIGYYEAELISLRDAATTLDEAEHQAG